MKIKFFVAREIQYFELRIFSFKFYLTRGFIASTRAFDLLTRAFNLAARAFCLQSREFQLITREFDLITPGFELVTRGFEIVTRGFELVTHRFEVVTRGFELVTYVLLFHPLIVFDLQYKINFKNKQAKNIFYWIGKLNPASVAALQDWQLLHRVLQNTILYSIIPNLQTNPY